MDISSIGGCASNIADIFSAKSSEKAEKTEEEMGVEAQYAVKLIKMAQQSEAVIGSILEDTAEISQEALKRFMSERGG